MSSVLSWIRPSFIYIDFPSVGVCFLLVWRNRLKIFYLPNPQISVRFSLFSIIQRFVILSVGEPAIFGFPAELMPMRCPRINDFNSKMASYIPFACFDSPMFPKWSVKSLRAPHHHHRQLMSRNSMAYGRFVKSHWGQARVRISPRRLISI